jgi:hypothetical protein
VVAVHAACVGVDKHSTVTILLLYAPAGLRSPWQRFDYAREAMCREYGGVAPSNSPVSKLEVGLPLAVELLVIADDTK